MKSAHLEPATIGYGRQEIRPEDVAAVTRVLLAERLTQGPAVTDFEQALCRQTGAGSAIALNSGTAALQLAMAALGVGPGSKVVTSANTFLASATAALWCGAEVEFVDIDARTLNLDLDALEARLEAGGVDLVVPVHFAGLPCDMQRLLELKARFGFRLLDDACHALGGRFEAGGQSYRVGECPAVDATVLSFHPVKQITTGEGGAVLTHEPETARRVQQLRHHGMAPDANARPFSDSSTCPPWFVPMSELGGNSRLSDLGAALGASQLARLDEILAARRAQVERYDSAFAEGGLEGLRPPPRSAGHAWHLYVLHCEVGQRDQLMAWLAERGIGSQLHYYPVPMQPYFRARYGEARVPNALEHARRALSIPLYPGLARVDQQRVVDALRAWCASREEARG